MRDSWTNLVFFSSRGELVGVSAVRVVSRRTKVREAGRHQVMCSAILPVFDSALLCPHSTITTAVIEDRPQYDPLIVTYHQTGDSADGRQGHQAAIMLSLYLLTQCMQVALDSQERNLQARDGQCLVSTDGLDYRSGEKPFTVQ